MIRFAVWTAVSTDAQTASDKVSLSEQETRCRAAGQGRGWSESAGPYVAAGYSRTRHVNLRDAELSIPPLRHLLDDAQKGRYDVLILQKEQPAISGGLFLKVPWQ